MTENTEMLFIIDSEKRNFEDCGMENIIRITDVQLLYNTATKIWLCLLYSIIV
jgi:hypothetical protein